MSQTSKRPRRLSPRKPASPFAPVCVHVHVRITLRTGSTWKRGAGALLIDPAFVSDTDCLREAESERFEEKSERSRR